MSNCEKDNILYHFIYLVRHCYSLENPLAMPGNIKKSDGPDPDPSPWLIVSPELKEKLKSKPYDAKKSCWVPEKATGGYLEGLIESTDGEKVTVQILETKEVQKTTFIYDTKLC